MANLTKVTSPSGVRVTVNSQYADRFSGFLKDLEGTGYRLRQSDTGGYNYRYIAGTNTLSRHATGDAIDVNWNSNPQTRAGTWKSDLPEDVGDIAARNGLRWGGNFGKPDPMHFEADKNWDGSKEATERLRNKNFVDGKSKSSERGGENRDKDDGKGKDGEQEGNKDTKDSNNSRDKEQKPPKPTKHNDIQGSVDNYQRTQTSSIASRLPTHEPWHGHPRSTEGPRMGLKESGGSPNQGGPSTGQGQGQSTGQRSGGGSGGSGGGSSSGGSSGGSTGSGGGSSRGGGGTGTSTSPSNDVGLRGSIGDGSTNSGPVGDASTNSTPSSVNYGRDLSHLGNQNFVRQNPNDVKGFIFHHTGGRGSPEGVQSTLNGGRGMSLGVQYIIDRDGTVHRSLPENSSGGHMRNGTGIGDGLNNRNTIGVEMIARNNADLTQAQIESARALYAEQAEKYPNLAPYGHGEVNKHKQSDEGMGAVDAIRKDLKKKGKKPKTADPGQNKDDQDKKPQASEQGQPGDAKQEGSGTSTAPSKAEEVPMSQRTLAGYKKSFEGTTITPSGGSAAP